MDIYTNVSIRGDLNVTTPSAQLLDSLSLRGANITSASNLNLSSTTGWVISITGNTTVTSFGSATAGVVRYLLFNSVLTLTHDNTSLILPYSANITTQIGDSATAVSLGSGNWKVVNYQSVTIPSTTTQIRVVSSSDQATVTPNSDTTDIVTLATLSQTTTFANPTGTPSGGQLLILRINSTLSRFISFGSIYSGVMPTATSGSGREDYIQFRYNAVTVKWDLVMSTIQTRLVIFKPADQSVTNSIVLVDDTDFTFYATANTSYRIVIRVSLTKAAGTGSYRAVLSMPSGDGVGFEILTRLNSTSIRNIPSAIVAINSSSATSDTEVQLYFDYLVKTGATAGQITFRWSQQTANAIATVFKEGSTMEVQKQ